MEGWRAMRIPDHATPGDACGQKTPPFFVLMGATRLQLKVRGEGAPCS